jgi:hypothetical protein
MNRKSFVFVVLLIVMLFVLAGCSSKAPDTSAPAAEPAKPTEAAPLKGDAKTESEAMPTTEAAPTEAAAPIQEAAPTDAAAPADASQSQTLPDKVSLEVNSTVPGRLEMDGLFLLNIEAGQKMTVKVAPGKHVLNLCNTQNACASAEVDINTDPFVLNLGRK